MNYKIVAALFVALSFVSLDISALNAVSDEKLIEIEQRLDDMSSIELRNQRRLLVREDEALVFEASNTQDPNKLKEIDARRSEIFSELNSIQKLLLAVGSAAVLAEVLDDDEDNTPPVVTLIGSASITVELGGTFSDPGATADTGESVSASGSVNTSQVGSYLITYSATDSSGNTGTATRTVNVVDTTNPVVTVTGANPATVELGASYTDAGATATDLAAVTVTTSGTVNTDAVGSYTLTYTATDASGNSATATRTVNVVDTTAPVVTVTGDNPATVELGATYTDAGATATDLSGTVTVSTSGSVDTDTVGSYTLTYTSTDASGNSGTATRTVNVVDTTAPVFTSSASFSLNENSTSVGTVSATDLASVTYSVSGTELSVNSLGALSLKTAADYETKKSYTATVTATDASSNATTQSITITVVDQNDNAPVFTSASSFTVNENETAIATLTATDVDTGSSGAVISDPITFSISGSGLSITTAGVLTFSPAADYETKKSYSATVTASDGTNATTQDITVTVVDLNDNAPTFTSSASFSVNENETALGTVTATDPDTGSTGAVKSDPVTYSISGSELAINSSTGALTLASGAAADYETKNSYSATVTASDGTNSTTQDITITIVDLNDNAPVFTSSASFSVNENQTAIGTVTATDVDTGSSGAFRSNPVTFSVSGSGFQSIRLQEL